MCDSSLLVLRCLFFLLLICFCNLIVMLSADLDMFLSTLMKQTLFLWLACGQTVDVSVDINEHKTS